MDAAGKAKSNGAQLAFPFGEQQDVMAVHWGLTKREYFAGSFASGVFAAIPEGTTVTPQEVAESIVLMTDALLAALSTEPPHDHAE